jgi:hypothetical protein
MSASARAPETMEAIMNAREIAQQIGQRRGDSDQFVRWWRKENDFVDYELIDRFLDELEEGQEIDGYELIDTETMWHHLKSRLGESVVREKHKAGEMIVWTRPGKGDECCRFSAEAIMAIFDEETGGNVIEG